jgi:hypothetical protein
MASGDKCRPTASVRPTLYAVFLEDPNRYFGSRG